MNTKSLAFKCCPGVFLLLAALVSSIPALGATITVNTFLDETNAGDSLCSLREAVMSVNAGADQGGCAADVSTNAYGTNDTIILQGGTYTLTIAPTGSEYAWTWNSTTNGYDITVNPDASQGDIDIEQSVNIVGAGVDTTIVDAGWSPANSVTDLSQDPGSATTGIGDRVFHVVGTTATAIDVHFSNLTVQGGHVGDELIGTGPDTQTWYLRRNGGGLAVGVAAVAYVPGAGGSGDTGLNGGNGGPGGTSGDEATTTYTWGLSNVKVTSNYAGDGGGVYSAAELTANKLMVFGNRATANGGGLYNDAPITLTASTLASNGAEGGGGLFDTGSHTSTVNGTAIASNVAVGGGGISARSGVTLNVTNSTISGNTANDVGGGLYTNGPVNLRFVTIADNYSFQDTNTGGSGINTFPSGAVAVTLKDTLLSHNLRGSDPATAVDGNCGQTGSGTPPITSLGYNLDSGMTCPLGAVGDLVSTNPMLGPLQLNGGPTLNQALENGSPAINAGIGIAGVTTDQRGAPRDAEPDIGAYEYVPGFAGTPGTSSSGCFIATAAYGSYLAPDVMVLRHFRDHYLMTNAPGRHLVAFYYRVSPPIADYIWRHETARTLTRWGLTPIVYGVKYPVAGWAMLFALIALPVGYRARKRAKVRRAERPPYGNDT